jgi:hypothetical protein
MTGYIQAEILGKVRGLKFGTLAAENITMRLLALGSATNGNYSSAMMSIIMYWGLFNNYFVKQQDMDFDFEQVSDFVDEKFGKPDTEEYFSPIIKAYEESQRTKDYIEGLKGKIEEVKKKMESISSQEVDGQTSEGSQPEGLDGV